MPKHHLLVNDVKKDDEFLHAYFGIRRGVEEKHVSINDATVLMRLIGQGILTIDSLSSEDGLRRIQEGLRIWDY